MRFMVMVRADADSEAGVMPSEEMLSEMGNWCCWTVLRTVRRRTGSPVFFQT
jgi:hypothetical protein